MWGAAGIPARVDAEEGGNAAGIGGLPSPQECVIGKISLELAVVFRVISLCITVPDIDDRAGDGAATVAAAGPEAAPGFVAAKLVVGE